MKIKKINPWREKFTSKLLGLVYRLDNIGNAKMEDNGESNFLKRLAEYYKEQNMVIMDIGANIGNYSEILMKERDQSNQDQYHLFEPQASCFEKLTKRFGQKNNFKLNRFGLSSEDKEVAIYKDSDESGLASVYDRDLDFYNLKMGSKEETRLMRSENYLKENNIRKIHLIKIDVEGHELEVLRGFDSLLHNEVIDFIQFEYGGANLDSRTTLLDFYHLLESAGFIICRLRKNYLEIRPYHPRLENFVNQNLVAVSRRICQNL